MKPFSKAFLVLHCVVFGLTSSQAFADDCTARIAEMFVGGPLDAYQRPPHQHEKRVTDVDGNLTSTFQSIVETPLRSISGPKGGTMTLTIDDDTWAGPGPEGPWSPSDNYMPKNREPWHKAMQGQQAKNLTETECVEGATLDGAAVNIVRYTTKTDPNPDMNNAFFGSTDTVYINAETAQVMQIEQTGFFSSWLPEPRKDTHVTRFIYDPDVKIVSPE